MQTILGASGVTGRELAKELYRNYTQNIRLVSRNPQQVNPTDQLFRADLLNKEQTLTAVKGSEIVYLTVGLPNDTNIWTEQFPVIMRNVLDACVMHKCKLVFLDNTYMYGKVSGIMKEDTLFNPIGEKAKVRAEISNMLLSEMQKGNIPALIGRAPEFYGKKDTKSITNGLIFNKIRQHKILNVFLNDNTLRTLIYAPDAGRSLALLGNTESAYNQTWHLPCDNNLLTGKGFIQLTSQIYGQELSYKILTRTEIEEKAVHNHNMQEVLELLPRYEVDNIFDSSKFTTQFPDFKITTYKEGITEIIDEIKNTVEA